MGGNALKNIELIRIRREDVEPTMEFMVKSLNLPNFDLNYVMDSLMGSVGKSPTSGDVDIAVNNYKAVFVGEPKLLVFDLRKINSACRSFLGDLYVNSKGLRGGQINTAWPIAGEPENGYIQVDFIAGKRAWLKFSHHSPGEASDYRGVYISTMLGVLAKMLKDYELTDPVTGERLARVGLRFNLERGLTRQWQIQKRKHQGTSKVDPDYWETHLSVKELPPRFTRIGFVDDPEAVVEMLLPGVKPNEIDTFEKIWDVVKDHPRWEHRINELKERFMEAVNRSSAIKNTPDGKAPIPEIFK